MATFVTSACRAPTCTLKPSDEAPGIGRVCAMRCRHHAIASPGGRKNSFARVRRSREISTTPVCSLPCLKCCIFIFNRWEGESRVTFSNWYSEIQALLKHNLHLISGNFKPRPTQTIKTWLPTTVARLKFNEFA